MQFLKLLLSLCLLFISDRQTAAQTAPLLLCCFDQKARHNSAEMQCAHLATIEGTHNIRVINSLRKRFYCTVESHIFSCELFLDLTVFSSQSSSVLAPGHSFYLNHIIQLYEMLHVYYVHWMALV